MELSTLNLFAAALSLRLSEGLKESAFVICPGLQTYRLKKAPWEISGDRRVWVAGTDEDPSYDRVTIKRLLGMEDDNYGKLEFQGYARNTAFQIRWVIDQMLTSPEVVNVYISTAGYHAPRCLLTFIKKWMIFGDTRRLRIGVVPTIDLLSPRGFSAGEYKKSGSVEEELERIEKYQKQGDVADAEEFYIFFQHYCEQQDEGVANLGEG